MNNNYVECCNQISNIFSNVVLRKKKSFKKVSNNNRYRQNLVQDL